MYEDVVTGYYMWQYTSIEQLLRNFGHLITKLEFSSLPFTQREVQLINWQIAKYCPNLQKISLSNVDFYLISETNQTFQNVVSVDLKYHHFTDILELDRIYPHMERLKIVSRFPVIFKSVVRSYPHLKHLEINEWGTSHESLLIQDLLELNPQLESLVIGGYPKLNVLKNAGERLENLTSLALTVRSSNIDGAHAAHFPNVRDFTLHIGWETIESLDHVPITFNHLEVLRISTSLSFENVANFIKVNEHLKVLAIYTTQTFSSVLKVLHGLADLEEIRLKWSKNIATADVLSLLNDFAKLNSVTFVVSIEEDFNDLLEIVPSEWSFKRKVDYTIYDEIYKTHHLTFERENVTGL